MNFITSLMQFIDFFLKYSSAYFRQTCRFNNSMNRTQVHLTQEVTTASGKVYGV